jgi:hypothetical protein
MIFSSMSDRCQQVQRWKLMVVILLIIVMLRMVLVSTVCFVVSFSFYFSIKLVADERPEETSSTSNYDPAKLFGRANSRQSSLKHYHTDSNTDTKGSSFKDPRSFSPDPDTIYRMSEVEEEKSEFERSSPRVIPAISFRPSTIIESLDNGPSAKVTTLDLQEIKSPPLTFRPKMSSRGTSFKRDVSAKFIDISSHEREIF